MKKVCEVRRLARYGIGLLLFYAPFAFYQKMYYWLVGENSYGDIHDFCLRIPLEHIWQGRIFTVGDLGSLSLGILLGTAFFLGPVFCGRFCVAGAIGEYLSRLLPHRLQVDWTIYLPPGPVRFGILTGFLLSPFVGGYLACAYCSYRLVEAGSLYLFYGTVMALPSSVILTGILWLVLFGIFTRGGRGFCNYLCPVGAVQSLVHILGCHWQLACRVVIQQEKCTVCSSCIRGCPMRALHITEKGISHELQHCITCGRCWEGCPTGALHYVRRERRK